MQLLAGGGGGLRSSSGAGPWQLAGRHGGAAFAGLPGMLPALSGGGGGLDAAAAALLLPGGMAGSRRRVGNGHESPEEGMVDVDPVLLLILQVGGGWHGHPSRPQGAPCTIVAGANKSAPATLQHTHARTYTAQLHASRRTHSQGSLYRNKKQRTSAPRRSSDGWVRGSAHLHDGSQPQQPPQLHQQHGEQHEAQQRPQGESCAHGGGPVKAEASGRRHPAAIVPGHPKWDAALLAADGSSGSFMLPAAALRGQREALPSGRVEGEGAEEELNGGVPLSKRLRRTGPYGSGGRGGGRGSGALPAMVALPPGPLHSRLAHRSGAGGGGPAQREGGADSSGQGGGGGVPSTSATPAVVRRVSARKGGALRSRPGGGQMPLGAAGAQGDGERGGLPCGAGDGRGSGDDTGGGRGRGGAGARARGGGAGGHWGAGDAGDDEIEHASRCVRVW